MPACLLLMLAYLYAHYMFASTTAHITAMFAAFYTAGLALGAPPMLFALMMAALQHHDDLNPLCNGYIACGIWFRLHHTG
jgi:hypothetical protein